MPRATVEDLAAIVRDLAVCDEPVETINGQGLPTCLLCDREMHPVTGIVDHAAHCPWLRARQAVDALAEQAAS